MGQQARLGDVQAEPGAVCVELAVRDLCVTEVKKAEVTVPCGEWRPALPFEPERRPAFAGKVELPDGQVGRASARKGDAVQGEEHGFRARSSEPAAPGHWSDWEADHREEGRWCLDAGLLGAALASGAEVGPAGWAIEIEGTVDAAAVLWTDVTDADVITTAHTGGDERWTLRLDAARVEELESAWRCAALEAWYRDGTLLRRTSWADASTRVSTSSLAASVAMAQPVCPDTAGNARDQVCDLGEDLVIQLSDAEDGDQLRTRVERAAPLVGACPEEVHQPILGAAAARFARIAVGGGFADLPLAQEELAGWLGEEWRALAEESVRQEVQRALGEAVAAQDLDAAEALVAEHGATMGAEWRAIADEQLVALVHQRFESALAEERTADAVDLLVDQAARLDDAWRDGARERLEELERVLEQAPAMVAYLSPAGDECVFRVERPGAPERVLVEVALGQACTGDYTLAHHPEGGRVIVAFGRAVFEVDVAEGRAEALPLAPARGGLAGATYDAAGRIIVQGEIEELQDGQGSCRAGKTCRFREGDGKYSFEPDGSWVFGASLYRAWRFEDGAWSVHATQVIEWHVGLDPSDFEMSIPDLAQTLKPRHREAIAGCLGAGGPGDSCEEVGELPGLDHGLSDAYDGPGWLIGGGGHPLAVGTYWYEGTVIAGPLAWKTARGWKRVPMGDRHWTAFEQNGRYLLTCVPDGSRPPSHDELKVFDLESHELVWSDLGWCPAWWEPLR